MTAPRGNRGTPGTTRRPAHATRLSIKVVSPPNEVDKVEVMRRLVEGMAELAAELVLSGEFESQNEAVSESSKIVPMPASRTP